MILHKKLVLFISVLLYFTVFLFVTPKNAIAQTLFSDNFNDGDAAGWTVIGSSGWNVSGGEYGILLNPGLSNSIPNTWDFNWTNVAYDLDLRGVQGVDRNVLVKFVNTSNFIELHVNASGMVLEKASTIGGGGILGSNGITLSNGVNYHFRFEVKDTGNIKVYLNSSLIFDVNEATPLLTNWKVGLRAGTGGTPITQVWFDNVVVTLLDVSTPTPSPTPTPTPTQSPTPSPTPTQSPTPSPTPTPVPTTGPFDLPFDYPGRPAINPSEFKSGFWNRLTATFDHVFKTRIFRPFTGDSYSSCLGPISCYDSHNGTDFSTLGGANVYSVAGGTVSYASPHTFNTCTPEKGGYGCVVIVQYPNNTFGLYAHLSKIFVLSDQPVTNSTLIGTMGNTGCPGCGLHLHFGVLKPVGTTALSAVKKMSKKDWQDLIYYAKPAPTQSAKAFCTYKSPSGVSFSFTDVSGWRGIGADPWSLSKSQGGCGVTSPYLWKFDIGSTP